MAVTFVIPKNKKRYFYELLFTVIQLSLMILLFDNFINNIFKHN
mgnify:CR=1